MAHLWIKEASQQWAVFPLDGEAFNLQANPPEPAPDPREIREAAAAVQLRRTSGKAPASWVLLAGTTTDVWVNGMPQLTGIHLATDPDEIRVGAMGAIYFSTETLARIEPFPGAERPLYCPRCKQEITKGTDAVRCPQCGVWYHQTADLPCYTYADKCALCGHKSDLNAGYRWTPEET